VLHTSPINSPWFYHQNIFTAVTEENHVKQNHDSWP
jgi:hypothetical protein